MIGLVNSHTRQLIAGAAKAGAAPTPSPALAAAPATTPARPSPPIISGQSRVISGHLGPRPPVEARLDGSEKAPRKFLECTTPARPTPAAGKTRGLPSSCAAECSAREYCDEKPTFIINH